MAVASNLEIPLSLFATMFVRVFLQQDGTYHSFQRENKSKIKVYLVQELGDRSFLCEYLKMKSGVF